MREVPLEAIGYFCRFRTANFHNNTKSELLRRLLQKIKIFKNFIFIFHLFLLQEGGAESLRRFLVGKPYPNPNPLLRGKESHAQDGFARRLIRYKKKKKKN